jgi:hypothetical protein
MSNLANLPSDWREILAHCDFELARDEIADFFRASNREAAAKGGYAVFREEFVAAWESFQRSPTYENAVISLTSAEGSHTMWRYFEACCPGGDFYLIKALLRRKEPDAPKEEEV